MNPRQKVRCVATVVMLVVVGLAAPAAAAKKLRWQVQAGDKFQIEMKQGMKQVLTIADQTIDIPSDMTIDMTWTVDGVDDEGIISMTQAIDRIRVKMKAPQGGDVEFDSASRDERTGVAKTLADIMGPMIGAKFTQTMNDRGKIIDVKVPMDALKGLDANPLMKQFFSDEAFADMMRKASPELPEEAIDKGFSWPSKTSTKTPVGVMKMDSTYVYQGEEDRDGKKLDKIAANVKLAFEEGDGPLKAKIEIVEQDNSGAMYFDTAAGHLAETSMKQSVLMKITANDNAITQRIENTVQMTVKRSNR